MSDPQPTFTPTRRGLLTGAIGGAIGLAVGAGGVAAIGSRDAAPAPAETTAPPRADGVYQAGIHTPSTPQKFGRLFVVDTDAAASAPTWLAALGARILAIARGEDIADILPDGPGDLTVTVGIGPRVVSAVDPTLPGAEALPDFVGDDAIPAAAKGGDVLLAAYSSDPTVLGAVLGQLQQLVPGGALRWEQLVFRGTGVGMKARNPLGFQDGVVVPKGDEALRENVWIGSGPLAGGTICVIRRLRLDTDRFRSLEVPEREKVIGRTLADGSPLSGGKPDAQVDLRAKTPEGEFIVPAASHARAAHPSFTGSTLMLRRSYSFENDRPGSAPEQGLAFISFQKELRTFVVTQQRLDDLDALMKFATPTASATFLILPGFSAGKPLGAELA